MSNRLRLIIAALVLGPILLYWGFSGAPTETAQSVPEVLREAQDYYATDLTTYQYTPEGRLDQILVTPRLDHFPQQEISKLETPRVTSVKRDLNTLIATGKTGIVQDDNSRIDLEGDAHVQDNGADDITHVESQHLIFFPETNEAETDLPVVIRSSMGRYDAIGMKANFELDTLHLLSNVRGIHEPDR